MLLADSNVWLALTLSKHEFHPATSAWLEELHPTDRAAFCRSTQQSYLRLLTTHAVLAPYGLPPLSNRAAWSAYDRILADDRFEWVEEPKGLEPIWKKLTDGTKASPKVWMDAYLAAFAMAGKYRFVSTDSGFKQFKGLDLILLTKN